MRLDLTQLIDKLALYFWQGAVSQLVYYIYVCYRGPSYFSEGLMKIISKNKKNPGTFSSKGLFSIEVIDGIEMNGGDDDFGDEMLRQKRKGGGL